MKYIRKISNGIEIDNNFINGSMSSYIEKLCKNNFKNISSIKNTCKMLGIKRSMPLYIDDNILLFPISVLKNHDSLYVNYFEVLDFIIKDENTIIIFRDNTYIDLSISRYRMNGLLKNVDIIINYIFN